MHSDYNKGLATGFIKQIQQDNKTAEEWIVLLVHAVAFLLARYINED